MDEIPIEEQGQPLPPNSPFMPQTPMDKYGSNIVTLTSPDSELRKLELKLRNMQEIKQQGGKTKLIAVGEPLLNDKGISAMVGFAENLASRHVILGMWEQKQIHNVMLEYSYAIVRDLVLNRRKYGIVDTTIMTQILHANIFIPYAILLRGLNSGDRKFWSTVTSEQIIQQTPLQQRKKGFLSGIFGGGPK